jgi:hypothetical protein
VQPRADGGESVHLHPNLDLSDRADGDELPGGYDEPDPGEAQAEALQGAEEEAGPADEAPTTAGLESDLADDDAAPAVEADASEDE